MLNVNQSVAIVETDEPFPVIEDRPYEISANVSAILTRAMYRNKVISEIGDPIVIVDAPAIRHGVGKCGAILGDINWRVSVTITQLE